MYRDGYIIACLKNFFYWHFKILNNSEVATYNEIIKVAITLHREKEDAYMAENKKIYITANELAEMLGVSVGHAYKLIRKLNQELEKEGFHVIPTARATWLTMNREGIRRLAAEELGLPTSPYRFAETEEEFIEAVKVIGMPCVVKPIMSSSGHGQSIIRKEEDIDRSWHYAQEGGRAGAGKVIVEGFVDFDYEITQLTVRHIGGTSFLEPVGHVQVDGDYRESWQPQAMSPVAKEKAREIAGKITEALGGRGIFGVELFVKGEDVIFSEVSPRPHDTGMVTMITQDLSQFALHARAVLGLPIPNIAFHGAGASRAVVVEGDSTQLSLGNLDKVLEQPDTQMRFFGKPEVHGHRRMAVLLARGLDVADARRKTGVMMEQLEIKL